MALPSMNFILITLLIEANSLPLSNLSQSIRESSNISFLNENKTGPEKKIISNISQNVNNEDGIENSAESGLNQNWKNDTCNCTCFTEFYKPTAMSATEADLEEGSNFSTAGITGIVMGCFTIVGVLSVVSYFLYSREVKARQSELQQHTQDLSDDCSMSSSSISIHFAVNDSEEVYSFDNESLEDITFEEYWQDMVLESKL